MHSHSRRGFLARTLGASWLGASLLEQAVLRAAHAQAQPAAPQPALFDIGKVAEGVYAAVARPSALINCNAAIFENANDLMIVDTHSKPSAVVSLVSQIRREITTKPIRYIVNTHFHWDHTQGTPSYKRIAPRADVVSSAATRSLIAELGAARLKASVEEVPKAVERYRKQLEAARTPEEKSHYERMISEARGYVREMQNYAPELPNVTFRDDLVLHDKAHDIHLAFRGRGHTAGDIVVFCPQKKVMAAGDLLHCFFPYIDDGYPREWPRTLRSAGEFEFTEAIGGHGPVQNGHDRLNQMAAYIEELTAAVENGKREGRTVEELERAITPAQLRSLQNGGYGEFVAEATRRGDAESVLKAPAAILADGVKSNVAAVYKSLERA
jgi:glyoxylase-like metal-dependent hydrolase (beta-lactamase superfamily II)